MFEEHQCELRGGCSTVNKEIKRYNMLMTEGATLLPLKLNSPEFQVPKKLLVDPQKNGLWIWDLDPRSVPI